MEGRLEARVWSRGFSGLNLSFRPGPPLAHHASAIDELRETMTPELLSLLVTQMREHPECAPVTRRHRVGPCLISLFMETCYPTRATQDN